FFVTGGSAGGFCRASSRGRTDGAIQSCRFWRYVAMVAGHVDGWRHVQYPTQIQARRALYGDRGSSDRTQSREKVSYRSEATSPAWWPNGLGHPVAVGGQNDLRYAIFPETRRLVIDD